MIPIFDENPTRRTPYVTVALIAVNVAVFAYLLSLSAEELAVLVDTYAFVPARWLADPTSPSQLLTVVTSAFLHAGWLHLLGNMLYLWIFGNNVEDRLGHWRFVLLYLLAAAVGVSVQSAIDPTSTTPLVGASGAIAGVLGAYALLFPRARVVTIVPIFFYVELAAIPAVFVIGFWFVLQLVQGLGALGSDLVGGVAWWAHVGGFVTGIVAATPVALVDAHSQRRRKRSQRTQKKRRV